MPEQKPITRSLSTAVEFTRAYALAIIFSAVMSMIAVVVAVLD